jgi:formylglycine-generating enzyme required for sulfatase activity
MWPLSLIWKLVEPLFKKAAESAASKTGDAIADRVGRKLNPLTVSELELPSGVKIESFKGLKPFDERDSDFFVHLLPGPLQYGLPPSIDFWKTRIESLGTTGQTFTIGVLSGYSGTGKSSLIRAGIVPRLCGDRIITAYIEAGRSDTRRRLLRALREKCPDLNAKGSLRAALDRKDRIPEGKKLLIIVDQFEQFLHSASEVEKRLVSDAFRRCDGTRLQVLIVVRDDFFGATARFITNLNVKLASDENYALLDGFTPRHAKKVLALFGKAHEALPSSGQLTPEQDAFLNSAISGLCDEGYVNCVQIAVFAQMLGQEVWNLSTLKKAGGAHGVGVMFLRKSLGREAISVEHRRHFDAAQRILARLLPIDDKDIKGSMQSRQSLLEASGYKSSPHEFDNLLDILDSKLHLVTPADSGTDEQYYQLTHDFIVAPLRSWIEESSAQTLRGLSRLLLERSSRVWHIRPGYWRLPWWWQQIRIYFFVRGRTPAQDSMLKVARNSSLVTWAVVTVALVGGALWLRSSVRHYTAQSLVAKLGAADLNEVPSIVSDLAPYGPITTPLLEDQLSGAPDGTPKRLRLSLALLPSAVEQREYIYQQLLQTKPSDFPVLRDALRPYSEHYIRRLSDTFEKGRSDQNEELALRAAAALASYDPDSQVLDSSKDAIAAILIRLPLADVTLWSDAFRPVHEKLISPLNRFYHDMTLPAIERSIAAQILTAYAADRINDLTELALDADEKQFQIVFSKLADLGERAAASMLQELNATVSSDLNDEEAEHASERRANAAVTLARLNHPEPLWPLLTASSDPTIRSFLIHRLGPMGVKSSLVIERLNVEQDLSTKRALILALGECESIPADEQTKMVNKLLGIYRELADPGLHSASEWLLTKWGQGGLLRPVLQHLKEIGHSTREEIAASFGPARAAVDTRWYVNSEGQTMVAFHGPFNVTFGSPGSESGREQSNVVNERLHDKTIERSFAVSATDVTVEDFRRFQPTYKLGNVYAPDPRCPINSVSWYDAARYCNWLSNKEQLTPVYDIEMQADNSAATIKLKDNYLSLSGYRLPTEAEWEYACRAGAVTSHYFGKGDKLLGKYAWYTKYSRDESLLPVGMLKPNDFGCFDMLGNAWQWCEERGSSYLVKNDEEDREDIDHVSKDDHRMVRGGSFTYPAWNDRCASRASYPPLTQNNNISFRVAQTIPIPPGN